MGYRSILLTGTTGLIGKETIEPLINAGFTIYAVSSKLQIPHNCINWITVDLFDTRAMENNIKKIKPEYLLHFAWNTKEGYLTSELNEKYVTSSMDLLKAFAENGGKRAVLCGTVFEYESLDKPLKEDNSLNPTTLYAKCKNDLRIRAEIFSKENNISFGWGRIFYVMGHGENKNRLLPYIVDNLKNDRKAVIKSGPLVRDYMYSKDIAAAFVGFLTSDVTGCVNICSGKGISIKDFAITIADKLDRLGLLKFQDDIGSQPKLIVGDNTILTKNIGYSPQWGIDEALDNILSDHT
jgi:nucleoside-diphosphate-sugar epimerase